MQGYNTNESLEKLLAEIKYSKAKGKEIPLFWKRLVAAAAVLLLISLVFYYMYRLNPSNVPNDRTAVRAEEVLPGGSRAILTLSNGSKVNLGAAGNASPIHEAGTRINRNGKGDLSYALTDIPAPTDKFNTIETPNGGQYHVVLSDGTKVWLNAASSISYPVNLKGNAPRLVTLKGEAYFQVAKDKQHPFIVKSGTQEVTVLGTHFNINSYSDEGKTVTTLEEGSVRVSANNRSILIKPGQQAIQTSADLITMSADMDMVLAWKNGDFEFKDADVGTIMRQISRWYDVDVVYPEGMPKDLITGGISRNSNLATVLRMLEMVRIKYKLENHSGRKTLIVSR